MKALFDTNVIIDYLNGVEAAREELALYEDVSISVITWMEILVGFSETEVSAGQSFLARFEIANIDAAIAEAAVALRRSHRIRLPDAIIWATARSQGRLFVTRNTKDFPQGDPGVRTPYQI